MNFRLASFSGLLAIASLTLCSCKNPPSKYLPRSENYIKDREVDWIVDQIDSGRWGNRVEMVADNLKDAYETAVNISLGQPFEDKTGVSEFKPKKGGSSNYWLDFALGDFANLAENDLSKPFACTESDVYFLVRLMNRKYGGVQELKSVEPSKNSLTLDYLRRYASDYYARCVARVEDPSDGMDKSVDKEAEAKMDKLISMGLQYEPDEAEIRLTIQAEKIYLLEGKFDASRMLDVIRRSGQTEGNKHWFKVMNSARLLTDILWDVCLKMRFISGLSVYNMARYLLPEKVSQIAVTPRFHKLNEYSRICLPFRDLDRSQVRKAIMGNLVVNGIQSAFTRN